MNIIHARHYGAAIIATLAICLCISPTCTQAQSKSASDTKSASPTPAQEPAATDSTATNRIVLPERAEVRVKIDKEIKSGADKTGDEVPFEVEDDVYSPSHVLLIATGTKAFGKITQSSRRGMFGKGGKLRFTCDYVLAPDGTHVPLRSDPIIERGKDNRGATAAVVILLSPLGLFVNGKDVTVKKDQEFTMYVDKDTTLDPITVPTTPAPAVSTPATTSTAANTSDK